MLEKRFGSPAEKYQERQGVISLFFPHICGVQKGHQRQLEPLPLGTEAAVKGGREEAAERDGGAFWSLAEDRSSVPPRASPRL